MKKPNGHFLCVDCGVMLISVASLGSADATAPAGFSACHSNQIRLGQLWKSGAQTFSTITKRATKRATEEARVETRLEAIEPNRELAGEMLPYGLITAYFHTSNFIADANEAFAHIPHAPSSESSATILIFNFSHQTKTQLAKSRFRAIVGEEKSHFKQVEPRRFWP